ncbi:MAG: thiamine-phosphate kinase [Pseudomonadota bacterium]
MYLLHSTRYHSVCNLQLALGRTLKPSFSLALGLSAETDENWVSEFAQGLGEDCKHYDISLSGGDTFKSNAGLVISITAFGEIPEFEYTSRLCGKAGQHVYVTGTIGDAALGLLARQEKLPDLTSKHQEFLINRYLLPEPRTSMRSVIRQFASSAMDISDGLVADLKKLCEASSVSARLNLPEVPLSTAVQEAIALESSLLETAISGGDDYEILFSVDPDNADALRNAAEECGVQVARIAELVEGNGSVSVIDETGKPINLKASGFNHFGA